MTQESRPASKRKKTLAALLFVFFISLLLLTSDSLFETFQLTFFPANEKNKSQEQAVVSTSPESTQPSSARPQKLSANYLEARSFPTPYIEKIYDHYTTVNGRLQLRFTPPTYVDHPVLITWEPKSAVSIQGHLSQNQDFSLIASTVKTLSAGQALFTKVYIGRNYYRLAEQNKPWGQINSFEITSKLLETDDPIQIPLEKFYFILDSKVLVPLKPVGDRNFENFIVEASPSLDFPPDKTQVYWIDQNARHLEFSTEQMVYLRARGVNESQEVTAYSQIQKVQIIEPIQPLAPRLAQQEFYITEGDTLTLSWDQSEQNISTHVTIKNSHGNTLKEMQIQTQTVTFDNFKVGNYTIQLRGVDRFDRLSSRSADANIFVAPISPLLSPLAQFETPRHPTSTEASLVYKPENIPLYLNRFYKESRIAIEGAGFALYSSKLTNENQPIPVTASLGLRLMTWKNNHGFEGSLKSGLGSVTDSTRNPIHVGLTDLEARYHYRFTMPINPFSGLGTSQVSLLIGLEHHKNDNPSGYFAKKYELGKVGFNVAFPILSQWTTGGEMILGQGLDQSKKYEISGFLDYYIKKNWAIGGGYRVHLFEAGSLDSSPEELPFREGSGEGYTTLKWIY